MKYFVSLILLVFFTYSPRAQDNSDIILPEPDKSGGMPLMQAFSSRASAREFDTRSVDLSLISNLLWAANGINRPESGKRTAPSAINAQDIDLYVLMNEQVYLYDPVSHVLKFIATGDFRKTVAASQEVFAEVPVMIILVSDISRFRFGDETGKLNWAAMDAGIVSQNISLYCTSAGLATVPRATMDIPGLREALSLKDTQHPMLNHPVGYKKTTGAEKH